MRKSAKTRRILCASSPGTCNNPSVEVAIGRRNETPAGLPRWQSRTIFAPRLHASVIIGRNRSKRRADEPDLQVRRGVVRSTAFVRTAPSPRLVGEGENAVRGDLGVTSVHSTLPRVHPDPLPKPAADRPNLSRGEATSLVGQQDRLAHRCRNRQAAASQLDGWPRSPQASHTLRLAEQLSADESPIRSQGGRSGAARTCSGGRRDAESLMT